MLVNHKDSSLELYPQIEVVAMYHKEKAQEFQTYSSYNSLYGDLVTTRVAKAIASKTWRWTLMNLAWTAGPVTVLAIYAGHSLGFGSKPSTQQIVYFATYTLVVGVFAVIAGILREALYEPKVQYEKEQLLEVIHRTYHLILHTRDLNLASLPIEERKIMGAYYTLQSAGCSVEAVKAAVYNLSSDRILAQAVERITVLQEQGMRSLITQIIEEHQENVVRAKTKLSKIAPITFQLLMNRIQGKPLTARSGRQRDSGFIQRALDAAEENDIDFMTITDAYELVTLVFELLNGRKIPVLVARFKGDRQIEKSKKLLDSTRKKYREILLERNNAIRLILEEMHTKQLLEAAGSGEILLKTFINEIRQLPHPNREEYKDIYQKVQLLQEHASEVFQQLQAARSAYLLCVRERGRGLSFVLQKSDLKKAGFYIQQTTIELDDSVKLVLSRLINKVVEEAVNRYDQSDIKELAIEIINELDHHLDLSDINRQTTIESSKAIQLGYLKPSFTPQTLVGWAQIVIMSMQENKRVAAHQLANNLVNYYGIELTESIKNLLEMEFGADKDYLNKLSLPSPAEIKQRSKKVAGIYKLPDFDELK